MTNSTTVAVLSPVTGGFYYGMIVAGIAREVAAVDGHVVLIQTLDAGLGSDEVVSAPDFATPTAWEHVDGVISIASATHRNYLDRLRAAGKVIVLASDEIEGFAAPSATPDNTSGVTESVAHLFAHGHTRIGYAANLIQPDMRARHDAYRAAMLAHGVEPNKKWFFDAFDNGELGGRDVAHQVVAAGMPVSALILATDRNAIGCLEQLAELGVSVPDDVAIVGFDGLEAGAHTVPTLSTVLQPFAEIGASAARLVLAALRGETVEPGAHLSPSTFLPRGSCGCPDDDVSLPVDGQIRYWRDEARMRFARSTLREKSMRDQYQISMQLLDRERADPRLLQWLEATELRGACLALWADDPPSARLQIVGVHDPDEALPGLVGTTCTVEQFPPLALIERADPRLNEVTIVVPVKAHGLDYGLLAVSGQVDALSTNGRETHNQWAALLTAALEQRNLVENVRISEERYGLWAEATNDGLWDWDLTTDNIYYSGRCMELLGHTHQGGSGTPSVWFDAVHPDDLDRVRADLASAMSGASGRVKFEHRVRSSDGSYRCLTCRVLSVAAPGAAAERLVGSIHDSEPRKQLEEQLRHWALYDEVTGLPNRKLFLERLNFAINDVRAPSGLRFAVLFLDLDGFKLVNDSFGHLAGDRLLTQMGHRLRGGLRPNDVAARFGGDEFALLLHNVDPAAIVQIVERLQAGVVQPIEVDGHRIAVTASVGIATSEGGYTNAEDVLRDADTAMYHAKSSESGSFAVFDVAMRATVLARMELQSEIRRAMQDKQFEIRYQPIVGLDSGHTIDRFEALVRWRHPRRGLLGPGEFLHDVQEIGLIVKLGHWVIDQVCAQIAEWQGSYDSTVNVSINVSHRELLEPGLQSYVLERIRRHALVPGNLTLEITESMIMSHPEVASIIIAELHAAGIGVQIDGVGAGASAINALRWFPIEALKIDHTFIRDIEVDPRTNTLVRILIDMGHGLGFDVVAQGVETEGQLEMLREMGCRKVQGFLFAEAVDADAAGRLLGRRLGGRPDDMP